MRRKPAPHLIDRARELIANAREVESLLETEDQWGIAILAAEHLAARATSLCDLIKDDLARAKDE